MLSVCLGPILKVSARVVSVSKHVVASIWSCEQLNSHLRGAKNRGSQGGSRAYVTCADYGPLRTRACLGVVIIGTVSKFNFRLYHSHLWPAPFTVFLGPGENQRFWLKSYSTKTARMCPHFSEWRVGGSCCVLRCPVYAHEAPRHEKL